MFRTIRNLIVNIMAAFIRDRDARHKFRNKYKIKSVYKKLLDLNKLLLNENEALSSKINSLLNKLDGLNNKYNFKFSHGTIASCKNFYSSIDSPELTNKYRNLINGLDSESIDCVSQILGRITLISQQKLGQEKTARGAIDIFTDTELQQLDKLRKEFRQRIVPLADGCYAYKNYILPLNQFRPNVFYYRHDIPKLKHLARIKDKYFIDAGGCIADSAIVMSEYTSGRIYTFEPTTVNYDMMLKTIELNNSKNIIPVKQGFGSKNEKLYIKLCPQNYGASKITSDQSEPQNPDDYEQVSITSLDNFVEGKDLDIGLIKVDIEGFEAEFLRGAYNTIKKYRPAMLISIYHNTSDFFDLKPLIESWDLGYTFKISHPVDGGLWGETLLICEQD